MSINATLVCKSTCSMFGPCTLGFSAFSVLTDILLLPVVSGHKMAADHTTTTHT